MHLESKYRNIFDATPLAMFVINRDYNIIEANSKFKLLYPRYNEGCQNTCYKVILPYTKNKPCSNCLVDRTFSTGKEASRIIQSIRNKHRVFYRIKTSPITSHSGSVIKVIETIEDITSRILAEKKIEKYNLEIESERNQRLIDLREKEEKLTALINTVHEIKSTNNLSDSIDKIMHGFFELEAVATAFVLCDADNMRMAAFYPNEILIKLNHIFRQGLYNMTIKNSEDLENPFAYTASVGKPIFYTGKEGIYNFFSSGFPGEHQDLIKNAVLLFNNLSLILFPLRTKFNIEGVIAVFSEQENLEANFEFYHFLSNSAAVEINRQKNSDKLISSERRYRNLVESSRDMIIVCDDKGKIKFSNKIFYEKTGIAASNRLPLNIYNITSSRYKSILKKSILSCIENHNNHEPVEILMDNIGKNTLWVEIVMNKVSEDNRDVQIIARDISTRKKMEIELGKLTIFNSKIVQNDYMGIITLHQDGTITSWNKGAKNILKFNEEDILGKNIIDLLILDDRNEIKKFQNRYKKSKYQFKDSVRIKDKNGNAVVVKYMESKIKDNTSKNIAIIAFFFDISEKEKLEAMSRDLIMKLNQAQMVTILSLAKLTEYRDIETGSHLERIMKYTECIAKELAQHDDFKNYITERYIVDLVNSCPLHDIGKVGIPDSILQKPAKLTYEEFEVMKTHTIIGGNTIMEAEKKVSGISYLNIGKEIAYYHHEKWDGTGYPLGLKGDKIPLSARIVAIADVYDAITSKRPYKDAFSHEIATKFIAMEVNTHFDEKVVRAFFRIEKDIIQWRKSYL